MFLHSAGIERLSIAWRSPCGAISTNTALLGTNREVSSNNTEFWIGNTFFLNLNISAVKPVDCNRLIMMITLLDKK